MEEDKELNETISKMLTFMKSAKKLVKKQI